MTNKQINKFNEELQKIDLPEPLFYKKRVFSINELKELEIFILDKINTIQNHRYLEVNPRWLATGKTDIEKGFMSLTKSIASGSTKTDGN